MRQTRRERTKTMIMIRGKKNQLEREKENVFCSALNGKVSVREMG